MTLRDLLARCLFITILVGLPRAADAQDAAKAAAEAAFDDGRRALKQGDIKAACERFRASLSLEDALGTRLHLADCYEMDGRLASAWATFREAQGIASARGDERRATVAGERAQLLKSRLPRIVVAVDASARVPGLKVTVGDTEIPSGSWSMEIPVDSGVTQVSARAPGHKNFSRQVLIPNQATVINVKVPALARTEVNQVSQPVVNSSNSGRSKLGASSPLQDAPNSSHQAAYGWITTGVGAVGLVAGSYLATRALSKNDASKSRCRPENASLCTARGAELRSEAKDYASYATVSLAAGGALLIGGITLVLTAPDEKASKSATQLQINADFAKGVQMFSLEGSF